MIASAIDPRTKTDLPGLGLKNGDDQIKVWNNVEDEPVKEYLKHENIFHSQPLQITPLAVTSSILARAGTNISTDLFASLADNDIDELEESIFDNVSLENEPRIVDQAELRNYQKLPVLSHSALAWGDPLALYRQTKATLPLMSPLARHILCIPASSVVSERTFSTSGNIVTKKRTRLAPESYEMRVRKRMKAKSSSSA